MTTYVGFISPVGHNHDDNCQTKNFLCKNGHKIIISKRNRCHVDGCNWMGRDKCHCHPGKKVDVWPEELEDKVKG